MVSDNDIRLSDIAKIVVPVLGRSLRSQAEQNMENFSSFAGYCRPGHHRPEAVNSGDDGPTGDIPG
jgi:hypothetical protein